MPPKTKRQSDEGSASGDEDLSESLPDEDNAFDNEIDSSFRKGGGAKEMKRRAMGEDEDPTIGKEKFESMKPDYMSQVRINTKKGTDVYLDEDEEERVSEHNRDTLFKVYFDEMVERVQKDLGGPLVLNDVDFSNMDSSLLQADNIRGTFFLLGIWLERGHMHTTVNFGDPTWASETINVHFNVYFFPLVI